MTKKLEYRELFYLPAVLLSRNDLSQLEKLLVEDPKTDKIDINLSFNSTSISAESFGELFTHQELPKSTDKLSISMQRWVTTEEYRGISCGVSLSLDYNHIGCQVHSFDQTWFLGKKSQIEKFFKARRPWYSYPNTLSPLFPAITMLLLCYGGVLLGKREYAAMVLPIACSIVLIIVTVLTFKQKLFPFVKINLQDSAPTKWGVNEWCALVGALSAFAALIQMLSALFK